MKSGPRLESAMGRGLRAALIGLVAGTAAGVAIATPIYLISGGDMGAGVAIRALLIGFPLGGFVGGLLVGLVLQEGVGGLVTRAFQGGRGRSKREYSHIQAMIIRGAYDEALEACAHEADAAPRDPDPLILGARVLSEHKGQYQSAAQWLRRALAIPKLTPQHEMAITLELVELYEQKLDTPTRALPHLARIMEVYPGTRAAEWAGTTMQQIRTDARDDDAAEPPAPDSAVGAEPESEAGKGPE